jgi:hypothetical protein
MKIWLVSRAMKLIFAAAAAMASAVVSASLLPGADEAELAAHEAGNRLCNGHGSYTAGMCEVRCDRPTFPLTLIPGLAS